MVVDYFNVVSIAALPAEADAVLIVDADAMLPLAVACKFFQAVAGQDTKVIERFGGIEEQQFSERCALQGSRLQYSSRFSV